MSSPAIVWDEKTSEDSIRPDWTSSADLFDLSTTSDEHSKRITRDDDVWDGMATVAGSRVPVFMVADLEAEGETVDDIHKRYPHLTRADLYAALSYAHAFHGVVEEERADYWRSVEQYKR